MKNIPENNELFKTNIYLYIKEYNMRYFTVQHRKNLSKARRNFLANETEEHKQQRIERCRNTWTKKMALLKQVEERTK